MYIMPMIGPIEQDLLYSWCEVLINLSWLLECIEGLYPTLILDDLLFYLQISSLNYL